MRFGISLISWMLPKILRMRREMVGLAFLRAEKSIDLVAMVFPALWARVVTRRPSLMCGAFPVLPRHTFGPLRIGQCPGGDRKGPGRTKGCGGADMLWMMPI